MNWLKKYWWLVLVGAVAVLGGFFHTEVARLVRNLFSRGSKVVDPWPYNDTTGCVEGLTPEHAAAQAGVNVDTICLAAMLASEHPNDPQLYKEQIAYAAINEARARGISVSKLLLTKTNPRHTGKFGAQADLESPKPHKSDGYASTRAVPHEDDMAIASLALSGLTDTPDMTEGARQFDSPKAQDAGYNKGIYSLDADGLAAKRQGEGKTEVNPDGIDPQILRFWKVA